ncbi:MAG: WG repeat-containing protein [Micromonosporaceae bacterium]|nr:WG repeat-containing protein [Micromonosporaceae bacterium]
MSRPVSSPPVSPAGTSAPISGAPISAAPVSAAPVSPSLPGPLFAMPSETDEPAATDPEQVLANWDWSFDPETLREVLDDEGKLQEIREQLTAKLNTLADNASRARLLSLRAVVSRIVGELDKALADGKLALAHAENTGELRRIAIAQARLAHVHQWRGEFDEADRLFTLANSTELPDRLRASMNQHAGRCAYDQGRYIEACNHFEKALELRKEEDPELIAQTELALDAVFRKVAANGWGPYPRSREEILQLRKPPTPALDEVTGLWGYTDADGSTCVAADFAEVQPFKDGVAWVLRPKQRRWELIDERGLTLIPAKAGYLGVSSFSDGLAWVSKDGNSRWIGIDKSNSVTISTGFHDVRPFRRGMAAVCRMERWGAVDGVGRVIVPFAYDAFATAMHDGRYIDGFSDEGLAVVELDGLKGVVDRAGRVIIEPAYPLLVIHPVAFLITDRAHRWGALDRYGRLLITPSHPSRMGVADEIDRLLADARPVL